MAGKAVTAWLALNITVIVLYTCVPSLFFNNGSGRIAGMPEMLFWFTLLPFLVLGLMAVLYLYDRKLAPGLRSGAPPARRKEKAP
jgi:hypothetical protein